MAFNADEYIDVIVEQICNNFKALDLAVKECPNLEKAKREYEKILDKNEEDFFALHLAKNKVSLYQLPQ